jgi:hypothetical protein
MQPPTYKISKIGSEEKTTPVKPISDPKFSGGKPKPLLRGILKTAKVKPVKDPAKHPPLKKVMRKHTIRLLTDAGASQRRKTIKQKLQKMKDEKVKELVVKHGLSKGKAPPKILREIAEGAMLAGFISFT